VQKHGKKDVLLDNVGWKTEACPVQSNVEVAITIEIIWTSRNATTAHGMKWSD